MRTLVCNRFVDHADVVGAAPTGDAPTTSSFPALMDWAKITASRDEKHFWDLLRLGGFMVNICVKIYFVNKEVARGFATKCCQTDTIQPLTPHPRTKWTLFRRRHFQMHLHEWKVLHFDLNFPEFYSQRSNWQYSSIVPESGLAQKIDEKPFSELMLTIRFTDLYMRH